MALQRALLRTKAGGGSCPISPGSSPRAFTPLQVPGLAQTRSFRVYFRGWDVILDLKHGA